MIELLDERIAIMTQRVADLQAALQALVDQKAAVEARVVNASDAEKALAVAIHNAFCTKTHGLGTGECPWNTEPNANNSATADWTAAAHIQWLASTQDAVQHARDNGWTIVEPSVNPGP